MHILKWCTIFLKQMRSKYFLLPSVIALNLMLFTSCLGSSDNDIEYSPDAQIYSFSMSSKADTANILNATSFTIDQVSGRIFNNEPLPYLFHVDSVVLNITGASSFIPFTSISLTMQPDSPYFWSQADSVAINRLKRITTTAQDGESVKRYEFQLNIYQQDPFILSWERKGDYLSVAPSSQKTIAFNNQFITYYKQGGTVRAVSTSDNDGTNWEAFPDVTGLPPTVQLESLLAYLGAVYVLDENGDVYTSDEQGVAWSRVPMEQSVVAIYGILPSATNGNILIAIEEEDGSHLFATTDDFSTIQEMNRVPVAMPLSGFTATSIENPESFSTRYIVLTDRVKGDDTVNTAIWILQEKEGEITSVSKSVDAQVAGSSLFYYDGRLYLMTVPDEGDTNTLLLSNNFGLDWAEAGENQAFPSDPSIFIPRTNASVIADDSNNIWVFGGVSISQTQLVDSWRGRLNKFAME